MTGEAQQAPGPVGSVVAGRFRMERSLGSGGMADVFAARDLATGRPVAVKLLKKDIADNAEATERLRREGEVLKKLEHPAIVRLETFGKLEDGRLFIAMELLEGETLGERIRRDGKLEPSDLTPIVVGACAGLEAAHQMGIVHRDLKPDNIFLEQGPQGMQVKLLDFGISKVTGSDKLTQTGEVLGTPRYMAPEQLSAERDLDGCTDVYALGVILYEALAGSPPFLAATPTDLIVAILHGKVTPLRSFRPDLPEDVDAVVTRAMSRAREARHGSARELAAAWLAAASPPERASVGAPAPAREGMRTAPLGSLTADEAPQAERRPDGELRPGTFSALRAAPAAVPAPRVEAADPEISADRTRAPSPSPRRTPTVPLEAATSGRRGAEEEVRLPTRGGRTMLIVLGVLAGALSAGLAILALKLLGPESEEAEHEAPAAAAELGSSSGSRAALDAPPSVAPEAEETDEPGADEADPGGAPGPAASQPSGAAAPGTSQPSGAQDPAPAREEAAPAPEPRRPGRRRATRAVSAPEPSPSSDEPAPSTPADLMRDARAALRDGDARACVTLVDRAIDAGAPTSALRLRGDCLVRLGDRDEGLKSYERFCRLAPDHPAIGEVRALVEGLGGRCD